MTDVRSPEPKGARRPLIQSACLTSELHLISVLLAMVQDYQRRTARRLPSGVWHVSRDPSRSLKLGLVNERTSRRRSRACAAWKSEVTRSEEPILASYSETIVVSTTIGEARRSLPSRLYFWRWQVYIIEVVTSDL